VFKRIIIIIIVITVITITFMQGIYTYIPETNYVARNLWNSSRCCWWSNEGKWDRAGWYRTAI